MTAGFNIKVRSFFNSFFKSYQSRCKCMFNNYIINQYGRVIYIKTQYYQPSRMTAKLSLKHMISFNKSFNNQIVKRIALLKTNIGSIDFQSEMSRITSPAIDSYILAQYFTHITDKYNFRRMCYQIESKIIYRLFKNAIIKYNEKTPLLSKDQVLGIEIGLHGRIPREPVRPRKTVQVKILGRRSKRLINKNTFLINRAEKVNPELGTFSI